MGKGRQLSETEITGLGLCPIVPTSGPAPYSPTHSIQIESSAGREPSKGLTLTYKLSIIIVPENGYTSYCVYCDVGCETELLSQVWFRRVSESRVGRRRSSK